ncbi:MAG: hypothetical protein OEV86_12985 [Candidatus Krumholzibacteria bacterium]|nr:hypothetical protein [Candidatus Krumholzibacteria bacterium]
MPQYTGVDKFPVGQGAMSFAHEFLQRFLADRDQRAQYARESQTAQTKQRQEMDLLRAQDQMARSRGEQQAMFEHTLTQEDDKRLKTISGLEKSAYGGAPITPAIVDIYARAAKVSPEDAKAYLESQAEAGKVERAHEIQQRQTGGSKGGADITEATRALNLRYGLSPDSQVASPDDFNARINAFRQDPEGGSALLEYERVNGRPMLTPQAPDEAKINTDVKNFESGWLAYYNNTSKNRGEFQQPMVGATTPPIDPTTGEVIDKSLAHDVAVTAARQNITPEKAAVIVVSRMEIANLAQEFGIDDTASPLFSKEDVDAVSSALGIKIPVKAGGLSLNVLGSLVGMGAITREQAYALIDRLTSPGSQLGSAYRDTGLPTGSPKKNLPVSQYLRR